MQTTVFRQIVLGLLLTAATSAKAVEVQVPNVPSAPASSDGYTTTPWEILFGFNAGATLKGVRVGVALPDTRTMASFNAGAHLHFGRFALLGELSGISTDVSGSGFRGYSTASVGLKFFILPVEWVASPYIGVISGMLVETTAGSNDEILGQVGGILGVHFAFNRKHGLNLESRQLILGNEFFITGGLAYTFRFAKSN